VIRQPSGGPAAELTAVSCAAAGSCEAGGWYGTLAPEIGPSDIMTAPQAHGRWAPARRGILPPGAASPYTYASSDTTYAAISAIETKGHWHRAVRFTLPAGAGSISQLTSVSCQPSGQCVAVGSYESGSAGYPMTATFSGGRWSAARPLRTIPAGAPGGSQVAVSAVSCARASVAGSCAVVGMFPNVSGEWEALAATGS
jgi:hypothetical protein